MISRSLFSIISLCLTLVLGAQSGMPQIPEDAFFVMRISGSTLQSKMSLDDLNALPVFQEMFKDGFRKSEIKSLQETGVDFDRSAYMFAEVGDSANYFTFMLPISNIEAFKNSMFREMRIKPEADDHYAKDELYVHWNDKAVIFNMAIDIPEPYDAYDPYGNGYIDYNEDVVEYASPYEETEIIEVPPSEELDDAMEDAKEAADQAVEDAVIQAREEADDHQTIEKEPDFDKFMSRHDQRMARIKALHQARMKRLQSNMGGNPLVGKQHLELARSKSDASLWLNFGDDDNVGALSLMQNMYGGMRYMGPYQAMMANMYGMYKGSSLFSEFNFGDDDITWNTDYTMSGDLAELQSESMKGKMNKRYLSYINSDELIGYMSMNIKMADYLKAYSRIISGMGDGDTTSMGEGMKLAGEAMEIILDEDAIAEFMPGTALITVSDFKRHMVEYQTYEFDENMERKWVTKEKEELMPSFTAMVETRKPDMVNRLLRIAVRESRGEVKETSFGFEFTDSPFPLYLFTKGNMFFIGNDRAQLGQIQSGNFKSVLDSKHKKAIMGNNSAVYFDAKHLIDDMMAVYPTGPMGEMASFMQGKAENMMITSKMSGKNVMNVNAKIDLPVNAENGFAWMMELINGIYEKETNN